MERVGLGCLVMETGESSDIRLSFWGRRILESSDGT